MPSIYSEQQLGPLCIPARSTHNPPMDTHCHPDLRNTLRQALAEHGGVRLAILFGSQATGLPVDLIDLKHAGEPLQGQILKNGTRLLGDDTDYAAPLSRHLFDAADFPPYRSRIPAERRQAWIGK